MARYQSNRHEKLMNILSAILRSPSHVGIIMIDKIELTLNRRFRLTKVLRVANKLGFKITEARYEHSPGYILIEGEGQKVYLRKSAKGFIYKVIVNPSRSVFFKKFIEFIELLFEFKLEYLKIVRMDIAFDINESIEGVLRGLVIRFKSKSRLEMDGSRITGFYCGSKRESFLIYDKYYQAQKEKTGETFQDPTTRIEVRLKKEKLPFRSLYQLSRISSDSISLLTDPFKKLIMNQLSFVKSETLSWKKRLRFERFLGALEFASLHQVRKRYNKNGNFDRLYGCLYKAETLVDPVTEARKSLTRFFGSWLDTAQVRCPDYLTA